MNINKIDFVKLFKEQKELSSQIQKSSELWDKKASYMDKRVKKSIYNDAFLSKIDLTDCQSMLDFGCGTGNISIPLAHKLKEIYAIDYSVGMLEKYLANAKEKKLENVIYYEKSWDDNWEHIPKCDIVLASRSINGISNIKDILLKLDSFAKKRVYLTYKTYFGFFDTKLYEALKRVKAPAPDYIYLVNILYSLGIYAKVDFIPVETKNQKNTTFDKFKDMVLWELGELNKDELTKLQIYFKSEIEGKEDKYAHWALISWDK